MRVHGEKDYLKLVQTFLMAKAESQTDDLISLSERKFIVNSIAEEKRIDGRGLYDVRAVRLSFGSTWGRVQVQLGQTRCEVLCEVLFCMVNVHR